MKLKTGAVETGTQAVLTMSQWDSIYVSCKSKLCKKVHSTRHLFYSREEPAKVQGKVVWIPWNQKEINDIIRIIAITANTQED